MSNVKKENEIPLAPMTAKTPQTEDSDSSSDSDDESEIGKRSQKPVYLGEDIEDEKKLISTMDKDSLYICIFTTSWCGCCKKLKEYLDKSFAEYKQLTKFIYIDCDNNPQLSKNLDVSTIPDTRIYRNGKHIANFIGSNIQGFSKIIKENER